LGLLTLVVAVAVLTLDQAVLVVQGVAVQAAQLTQMAWLELLILVAVVVALAGVIMPLG
jgi:hypothetical protein